MSNSNNPTNFDFLKEYGQEIIDEETCFEKQLEQLFKNLKEKKNGEQLFHDEGGAKKSFRWNKNMPKELLPKLS